MKNGWRRSGAHPFFLYDLTIDRLLQRPPTTCVIVTDTRDVISKRGDSFLVQRTPAPLFTVLEVIWIPKQENNGLAVR
ncbi:hypothetical protein LJR153_006817 [Paenibacillus sp. LjRoot153]